MIRLTNAKSDEIGRILTELLGDGRCRIISDTRTNSLLVQTDDMMLKTITAIIDKIDVPADASPGNPRRSK